MCVRFSMPACQSFFALLAMYGVFSVEKDLYDYYHHHHHHHYQKAHPTRV